MLQYSSDDDVVENPAIITSEEAKKRRQMEKEMKKFQKIENKQNVQDYQENFVTTNYTHINSKVEKLRFKKQEDPTQGKVSTSEKVLINRRVLNDYIHIVNKRQDVVDQMEDNFWTMVQLYDGTLHYFNKYYGKNLESKLEKLKRILKPEHRYLLNSIDKNEKRIKRRILEFQNVKNSNDPMLKKALEECQNIEEIVNKNHEAIRQRIIDRHNKLKSESHIEKLSKKKGYLVNEREIDQNRQNQIVMNEVQKFGSDRIKLQLFEQDMKTIIENKEIKVKIHKIQQSLDKINAQESATQTKQPDQSIPEIQEPDISEDSHKIASSLLHTHSPTHDSVHTPSSDYFSHKNNDIENGFLKKSGNPFLDPKEGNSMVLEQSVFSRDTLLHGRVNDFQNSQEEIKQSFHSTTLGEPPKIEDKSHGNHIKNESYSSFYKRESKPTGQSQSLHSLIPSSFASQSHRKLSNKDLHPDHITLSGFPSPPSTSYTSPTRQLVSSSINSRRSFGHIPETQIKEKKEKSKSVVSFAFSSSSFSQDAPQVLAQDAESVQTIKQTLPNSSKGTQPILKVKKQLVQNKSVIDFGTKPNQPYIQLKQRKASFDQTVTAPENRIITSPFDKAPSIQSIQSPLKPALKKKLSVITAEGSHQRSTTEGFQTLDTLQNSQLFSQKLNTVSSQSEMQKQTEDNSKQKLINLFNFDSLIAQTPNPSNTRESKLRRQITMIPNEYSSLGAQSSGKLLKRKIGSMDLTSNYSLNIEEQKAQEIPIIEWNSKAKKEKEVKIIEPPQEESKEEEDKEKKKEEGSKEKKKPKRGKQNLFDKKDNAKKLAASMSKPLLRNKIYNESDIFKYKKINQFVISEYYEKKILNLQKDEIPLLTAKELEDIENEKMKKSLLNNVQLNKQVSHRHLFWNNVEAKKADFLSLEKQPDLVIGAEAEEKYEQEVTRKLGSAISNLYRDLQKECSDQMHQSKTFSKDIIQGEKELIEDHKKLKHEYSELLGPKVYKSVYVEQILNQTKKQLNIKLHNKRPKLSSPERILQNLLKQEKKLNAWGKTLRQANTEEPGEKKYSLIANSVAPSSSQEVKKSKREQSLEEINKYIEKVQNSQHQASLKKQLEQLMNLDSNRKAMFEMTQHRFLQRNTTRDRSKNKYISELMQKNNIDPNTFDQLQQEISKKQPQVGGSDQSQKPIVKQDIQPVVDL